MADSRSWSIYETLRDLARVRCASRQGVEGLDRDRAPEAVVGAEGLQGAHLQGRPASRRRLPLRDDSARWQGHVGQVHLSRDQGARAHGLHRLVFGSEGRRDAPSLVAELAAGNALYRHLRGAGRQDQGQRAVDSRGFRDGDGAQDLRRRARRHEAGLGRNHGPVRRIPGEEMIKAIAIIVAVLLAGILIFAATRPDTFRVQRSTSIKAPPEKIFPLINDLQRWGAWSPYEKRDPAMKRTFGA